MKELNDKLNTWAGTNGIDYTDPEFGIAQCFKWLVPKLLEKLIFVELHVSSNDCFAVLKDYGNARQKIESLPRYDIDMPTWLADAETPSLAFCLAIEKFIDGGG